MLTIAIVNDRTGTEHIGNYDYEVCVNNRVIHRGRIEGHRRSQRWQVLLQTLMEQSLIEQESPCSPTTR